MVPTVFKFSQKKSFNQNKREAPRQINRYFVSAKIGIREKFVFKRLYFFMSNYGEVFRRKHFSKNIKI